MHAGNTGTIGGTKSGITGAGHCLNTGQHRHGRHGVHGTGGGAHGLQHGGGGEHELQQGSRPQGNIAGHVEPKLQQHGEHIILFGLYNL